MIAAMNLSEYILVSSGLTVLAIIVAVCAMACIGIGADERKPYWYIPGWLVLIGVIYGMILWYGNVRHESDKEICATRPYHRWVHTDEVLTTADGKSVVVNQHWCALIAPPEDS